MFYSKLEVLNIKFIYNKTNKNNIDKIVTLC